MGFSNQLHTPTSSSPCHTEEDAVCTVFFARNRTTMPLSSVTTLIKPNTTANTANYAGQHVKQDFHV